eukprot:3838481-Pleurochrysis_carterae.AAC.1
MPRRQTAHCRVYICANCSQRGQAGELTKRKHSHCKCERHAPMLRAASGMQNGHYSLPRERLFRRPLGLSALSALSMASIELAG